MPGKPAARFRFASLDGQNGWRWTVRLLEHHAALVSKMIGVGLL